MSNACSNYSTINNAGQWLFGVVLLLDRITLLREPEQNARSAAATALEQIGEVAVPGLLEALRDPEWHVRSMQWYRALHKEPSERYPSATRRLATHNQAGPITCASDFQKRCAHGRSPKGGTAAPKPAAHSTSAPSAIKRATSKPSAPKPNPSPRLPRPSQHHTCTTGNNVSAFSLPPW
jgi:hypothetical protein